MDVHVEIADLYVSFYFFFPFLEFVNILPLLYTPVDLIQANISEKSTSINVSHALSKEMNEIYRAFFQNEFFYNKKSASQRFFFS